ncbi:MAG TPA: SagB/ThcOx family dehydrogenase [bacterium]|nr:SagB/ThcOx family dehydrogenase [bacterium]HOL67827.1 SagB/ThcOx family dehydrogenase [bacterium]HPP11355.1 SagB/ThcOx family dehydrogenase [bacterium]
MSEIRLPAPRCHNKICLIDLLARRRSVRTYSQQPLSLQEVSNLLWACDGQTVSWGGRTAPSAGATYPLNIYLVAGNVEQLSPAFYAYNIQEHSLKLLLSSDLRNNLARAAYGQSMLKEAPATIVITASPERTTTRYGQRGWRYIFMESGHCGQNIHLLAVDLDLATVMVGAFDDHQVQACLQLSEEVLYLCPVGHPSSAHEPKQ